MTLFSIKVLRIAFCGALLLNGFSPVIATSGKEVSENNIFYTLFDGEQIKVDHDNLYVDYNDDDSESSWYWTKRNLGPTLESSVSGKVLLSFGWRRRMVVVVSKKNVDCFVLWLCYCYHVPY